MLKPSRGKIHHHKHFLHHKQVLLEAFIGTKEKEVPHQLNL